MHILLRHSILFSLFANLPHFLSQASVPVYLSPNHIVPTGHFAAESLLRSSTESVGETWIKVKDSDHSEYWLKREDVIRPIELSRRARVQRSDSGPWSKDLQQLRADATLTLLDFKRGYVLVLDDKTQKKWTIHESHLKPEPRDLGYIILEKNSSLFSSAKLTQKVSTAEIGSKWILQRIDPKFLKVAEPKTSKAYYLKNESQFLSRFDFSDLVKTQRGIIQGDKIDWGKDSVYEIHVKKSWLFSSTDSSLGYRKPASHSSTVTTLRPFSPLVLLDETYNRWIKSTIKGDVVWWNIDQRVDATSVRLGEMLKKEVYSLAQHPKNSQQLLISSAGVYYSDEAQSFRPIEKFEGQNLPVDIDHQGNLYVGEWVSKDKGHSFQPYLRWESILSELRKKSFKKMNKVTLSEIHSPSSKDKSLKVLLNVDHRKVWLETADGQNWKIQL